MNKQELDTIRVLRSKMLEATRQQWDKDHKEVVEAIALEDAHRREENRRAQESYQAKLKTQAEAEIAERERQENQVFDELVAGDLKRKKSEWLIANSLYSEDSAELIWQSCIMPIVRQTLIDTLRQKLYEDRYARYLANNGGTNIY